MNRYKIDMDYFKRHITVQHFAKQQTLRTTKEKTMEITNSSYISSSSALRGMNRTDKAVAETLQQTTQLSASAKDSISFSEEALRLSDVGKTEAGQSGESTKIRFDLVNRIKAEINAGTYDTPEKMDAAIERMATRILM